MAWGAAETLENLKEYCKLFTCDLLMPGYSLNVEIHVCICDVRNLVGHVNSDQRIVPNDLYTPYHLFQRAEDQPECAKGI